MFFFLCFVSIQSNQQRKRKKSKKTPRPKNKNAKVCQKIEKWTSLFLSFFFFFHQYHGVKHHKEGLFSKKSRKFEAHYRKGTIGFYKTAKLAAKAYDRNIVDRWGLDKAKRFLNFPQDWRETESESESESEDDEREEVKPTKNMNKIEKV